MITDTHIHLYDDRYLDNLDEIIKEANSSGVKKMIIVGYDYSSSRKAIELANNYEGLYAAVGLHPSEVHLEDDLELSWVRDLVKEPKVIAIGEIGLDYYWSKEFKDLQKEMFIKQIKLANEFNLPISIHSRDASLDTFNILKDNRVSGVLHCYSQSNELAKEYIKLGYFLGIGGVLTFKNSKEIKDVVRDIPLEYLVVETDGPYLAPMPYRGKLNKPSYLTYILEDIAKIKDLPFEYVQEEIEKNVKKVFKI